MHFKKMSVKNYAYARLRIKHEIFTDYKESEILITCAWNYSLTSTND